MVIRALVDVSAMFVDLSRWPDTQDRVFSARRSCWMAPLERIDDDTYRMGVGTGFQVEWFAYADFDFGCLLTYAMRLVYVEDEWTVEGSALANGRDGEDELIELPTHHAVDDEDLVAGLRFMAESLQAVRREAHKMFLERYAR
jgi:hypothetical protein